MTIPPLSKPSIPQPRIKLDDEIVTPPLQKKLCISFYENASRIFPVETSGLELAAKTSSFASFIYQEVNAIFSNKIDVLPLIDRNIRVSKKRHSFFVSQINQIFKQTPARSFWITITKSQTICLHIIGNTIGEGSFKKAKVVSSYSFQNDTHNHQYHISSESINVLKRITNVKSQVMVLNGADLYYSFFCDIQAMALASKMFPKTNYMMPSKVLGTFGGKEHRKLEILDEYKTYLMADLIDQIRDNSPTNDFSFNDFLECFQSDLNFLQIIHSFGNIHGDFGSTNVLVEKVGNAWQSTVFDFDLFQKISYSSTKSSFVEGKFLLSRECFCAYGINLPSQDVYLAITNYLFDMVFADAWNLIENNDTLFNKSVSDCSKKSIIFRFSSILEIIPSILRFSVKKHFPEKSRAIFDDIDGDILNQILIALGDLSYVQPVPLDEIKQIWMMTKTLCIAFPILHNNLLLFEQFADDPDTLFSYFNNDLLKSTIPPIIQNMILTQSAKHLENEIQNFKEICDNLFNNLHHETALFSTLKNMTLENIKELDEYLMDWGNTKKLLKPFDD